VLLALTRLAPCPPGADHPARPLVPSLPCGVVLGRIQSTLAASDEVLFHLQGTEAAFKPAPGGEKYSGGPFAVTPRSQVAIGELMCRRSGRSGTADVLSFSEFVTKLNQDRELQLWIRPVLRDLDALRRAARAANMKTRGRQRQPKHTTVRTLKEHAASILGARPFFVQNALQDLIVRARRGGHGRAAEGDGSPLTRVPVRLCRTSWTPHLSKSFDRTTAGA
jgi:hypothetical protein